MKIVVWGRQNGKTTAAVNWVKEGTVRKEWPGWTRTLLVPDVHAAALLRRRYGLDEGQVMSWHEWRGARAIKRDVEVGIDNAEVMLAEIIGRYNHLGLLTINTEDDDVTTRREQ